MGSFRLMSDLLLFAFCAAAAGVFAYGVNSYLRFGLRAGRRRDQRIDSPLPELPETFMTLKVRQFYRAQYSSRAACKLLPRIRAARLGFWAKLHMIMHLTRYNMHPLMLLLALLAFPAAASMPNVAPELSPVISALILASMLAPMPGRLAGQRVLTPRWWGGILSVPAATCIGLGLSVSNSRAVLEVLLGRRTGVLRGMEPKVDLKARAPRTSVILPWIEVVLGVYCALGFSFCISSGNLAFSPVLLVFALSFLVTGLAGLREIHAQRAARLRLILGPRRIPFPAAAVRDPRSRPAA